MTDPTSAPRPRHPLEAPPGPPPAPRQRVTLHIPSVRPLATYALIAINLIVFGVRLLSPALDEQVFLWGANRGVEVFNGDYYRLLSGMFLHASVYNLRGDWALENLAHIGFNMYLLWAVGTSLERLFGHTRFLIVYLLGGLLGSLASALLSPQAASVGASGAVFAIVAGEYIYLWHHRRLMGAAGRERRRSLVIFGIMNLAIGLLSALPGSRVRINNWGHLGGLVGGLLLAYFISPILTLRRDPDHPGDLLGEDINPLQRRLWVVSLYSTGLVILLFVGVATLSG